MPWTTGPYDRTMSQDDSQLSNPEDFYLTVPMAAASSRGQEHGGLFTFTKQYSKSCGDLSNSADERFMDAHSPETSTPLEELPNNIVSGANLPSSFDPIPREQSRSVPLVQRPWDNGPSSIFHSLSPSNKLSILPPVIEEVVPEIVDSAKRRSTQAPRNHFIQRPEQSVQAPYDDTRAVWHDNIRLRGLHETQALKICELEEDLKREKDRTKSLTNTIVHLEARLEASNIDRIDLMEGFGEACSMIDAQMQRQNATQQELDLTKNHGPGPRQPITPAASPKNYRVRPYVTPPMSMKSWSPRSPLHQVQDNSSVPEVASHQAPNTSLLTLREVELEKRLVTAETACEKMAKLLHSEIGRQSRQAAISPSTAMTPVEAEILASTRKRFEEVLPSANRSEMHSISDQQIFAQRLERELHHCVKEIVMYKLDIQDYKKDLKRAHAKIQELQGSVQTPQLGTKQRSPSIKDLPRLKTNAAEIAGLGIDPSSHVQTPSKSPLGDRTSSGTSSAPALSTPQSASLYVNKALPKLPEQQTPTRAGHKRSSASRATGSPMSITRPPTRPCSGQNNVLSSTPVEVFCGSSF